MARTGCSTRPLRFSFWAILFLSLSGGCAEVVGSGVSRSEMRDVVGGFHEVWLAGSGEVRIEQAGSDSLTVEAEDNLLPLLESTVSAGRLVLDTKGHVNLRPTKPIRYLITVAHLDAAGVSGSGNLSVERLDAGHFKSTISGSGSTRLVGRATDVTLSISGSGSHDAQKLEATSGRVNISGSGSTVVNVADELDVSISGSGSVTYLGRPSLEQQISGSGSVHRRKQATTATTPAP